MTPPEMPHPETQETTAETQKAAERPQKTCRCGHAIGSIHVHPEPVYSMIGWLLLLIGATPNPRYAVFRCGRCSQTVGATRDPAILKEFTA